MDLEQHKTKIIKKLQDVQNKEILDEIDTVLNCNYVVTYTVEGKPLTRNEYINHVESISESVANGSKTYSTEEVRRRIFSTK